MGGSFGVDDALVSTFVRGQRLGLGYTQQHAAWNHELDRKGFIRQMAEWGVTFTDLWLMNSWAYHTPHQQPWVQRPDGLWDLEQFSEPWFEDLEWFIDECRANGIVTMITPMDRFVLSKVPDPMHPVRRNVQGVRWGEPDEDTFLFAPPDVYLVTLVFEIIRRMGDKLGPIRLANEFPEKPWHFTFAQIIRSFKPDADLVVNRQEDSPGQFLNMRVGEGLIDRYQFHWNGGGNGPQSLKHGLSALDAVWPRETEAGRPDTMNKLLAVVDPNRVIFCTDGARNGGPVERAYNYELIQPLLIEALQRGINVLHQSCIKMAEPHSVENMRFDEPMMLALSEVYHG